MAYKQIYETVNNVVGQALGRSDLAVIDDVGLIALGNTILNSQTNTENFLNVLVQRIGKTIIAVRDYKSMFDDLITDNFTYGQIVQKINFRLISAEADESYGLTDGNSVDMYKVNKPKISQKLFTTETPWQIRVTIQKVHLKEAFLSAEKMNSFLSGVYTTIQNSIEIGLENLARACLTNYMGEVSDKPTRAINVLEVYNTETNKSLTVNGAKHDGDFLRWLVGYIKKTSTRMVAMSNIFNDGTEDRHTPKALQKLFVSTDWETQLETVVQYAAFHDDYVKLNGFKEIPFWQSIKDPTAFNVKRASDEKEVTQANVVACLFDRDALGVLKEEEWSGTSPFNVAGGYWNTYYHMKHMYFNDLSENFVMFYLAEV